MCRFLLASLEAAGKNPKAGAIDGCIDDIRHEGDTFYIYGWACQRESCARVPIFLQHTDYYCADDSPKEKQIRTLIWERAKI
jgi:hypothetical protein